MSTRLCFKIPFMSLDIDYPRSLILETDSGYAIMGKIIKFCYFSKYKIYYIVISFCYTSVSRLALRICTYLCCCCYLGGIFQFECYPDLMLPTIKRSSIVACFFNNKRQECAVRTAAQVYSVS